MFEYTLASVSKKKDKKKWALFITTSVVWASIFVFSIIASIFVYDARLENHLQLLTMVALPPPPPPPPPPPKSMMNRTNPTSTIVKTSMNPGSFNPNLILPVINKVDLPNTDTGNDMGIEGGVEGGVIGGVLGGVEGGVLGGVIGGVKGGVLTNGSGEQNFNPPPPPPVQKEAVETAKEPIASVPKIVRRTEGVIRGTAIFSPIPTYPLLARSANVQGDVEIEIVVDEEGNVISARVVSGHIMLQQAALSTAKQWKFKPTLLSNTPVKVTGKLTFRFQF